MAKCKVCKTNIPDGAEFCSDCQDKKGAIASESYLDDLLNSVKNTAPTTESIYKKKSNPDKKDKVMISTETQTTELPTPDFQDYETYAVDIGDIEDFDQFYSEEDLSDLPNDIVIGDEDLFGEDIASFLSGQSETPQSNNQINVEHNPSDDIQPKQQSMDEIHQPMNMGQMVEEEVPMEDYLNEDSSFEEAQQPEELVFLDDDINQALASVDDPMEEVYYTEENNTENIEEEEIPADNLENINTNEISEFEKDDDFDTDLNNLLNSISDYSESEQNSEDVNEPKPATELEFELAEGDGFETIEQEEDDFLSLLNQISNDDPVADDVRTINDLLSGSVKPEREASILSDVGEVFSDALKVVTTLNDGSGSAPEAAPEEKEKKGKKKEKKAKKDKDKTDGEDKPKKGFFQRLFGNVKDETAAAAEKKAKQSGEEGLAEKEATPKGKGKKSKKGAPAAEEAAKAEGGKGKGGKGKAAEAGEDGGKGKKKEKKEKKKKTKEIIQVIDEIEEDEGRINRLGAAVVFVFFGLLVALLLTGTNIVSYSISIQNATKYFDNKKYTEAYNEVYGMEIKDEDIETYQKIMTVMFVNKQLNSYNSYYSMEMYPQALDSLLKGLKRYDKYIELATMLGIETDLKYVRNQIIAELNQEFHLTEEDALRLNSYSNMKEYSLEVYNTVLENMSN